MRFAPLPLFLAALTSSPTAQDYSHREEVRVERVVVDAYVTDRRSRAIQGLTPTDFRLRVDGEIVPIESVDWIPADRPQVETSEVASALPRSLAESIPPAEIQPPGPGRLIILFFQADLSVVDRIIGNLRIAYWSRHFVDTLLPSDRVAVVSFDSRLKLRQDFTDDKEKLVTAIHDAIRFGVAPRQPAGSPPSLARGFDYAAARQAVTPEGALAIVARAAGPIVGAKTMIYFGYGLQTIGGLAGPNPRDTRDLLEAMPLVADARISIFTIDTPVSGHTLTKTLRGLAEVTGGSYQQPIFMPDITLGNVLEATSGRYEIVFKKPDLPRGVHTIEITLASRSGRVMAKTGYVD